MIQPGLRVLMLTPDVGFLDRRIAQEAATLAARGDTVDIFAVFGPLNVPALPSGVRSLAPASAPASPGSVERGARRLKKGLKRTVPLVHDLLDRAQYAVTDRAAAIADAHERHLLGIGRYDLVFAHDIPVMPLAVRLRAAWGSPIVLDLHEAFPEMEEAIPSRPARAYWRRVEAGSIPQADSLMCVNEGLVDHLIRRYHPRASVEIVHNSVPFVPRSDLASGAIHELYGLSEPTRVLVFAGSLRPANNLEAVVRGFARARLDGWALAFLGSGPDQRRLEEIIREEGAVESVRIGRRMAQDDLVPALGSADVGILPYTAIGLNHTIATPNKLFEYIQARLPVASSRLPMVDRILDANGNGFSVDFSTPETVARDLRRFIGEDLGRFTPQILEGAAEAVCWERDEPALLRAVEAALAGSSHA